MRPKPTMKPILARGLDYSSGTISGAAIKSAGYTFVCRYVDAPSYVGGKHIRPGEYINLAQAGVDVFLVFEIGTADMLAGRNGGVANAQRARAGAQWVGYPPGRPIFFACDMHVTQSQLPAALDYVDGVISVLGNATTGIYGFWELVDECIATNRGAAYWQAGIMPDTTDAVHMWQRNDGVVAVGGIQCDVNDLLIPIPMGGGVVPDPQSEGDYLYRRLCGAQKPWAGGISDIDDVVNAEDYDALQFIMRNNVEIHQILLLVRQMQAEIAALKANRSGQ